MKIKKIITGLFLLAISASTLAMLPPKYLSVPEWQSCVKTTTKESAQFVCLPAERPANCPLESWKALTLKRLIAHCPRTLMSS